MVWCYLSKMPSTFFVKEFLTHWGREFHKAKLTFDFRISVTGLGRTQSPLQASYPHPMDEWDYEKGNYRLRSLMQKWVWGRVLCIGNSFLSVKAKPWRAAQVSWLHTAADIGQHYLFDYWKKPGLEPQTHEIYDFINHGLGLPYLTKATKKVNSMACEHFICAKG